MVTRTRRWVIIHIDAIDNYEGIGHNGRCFFIGEDEAVIDTITTTRSISGKDIESKINL